MLACHCTLYKLHSSLSDDISAPGGPRIFRGEELAEIPLGTSKWKELWIQSACMEIWSWDARLIVCNCGMKKVKALWIRSSEIFMFFHE
jgi:hypothetical protein